MSLIKISGNGSGTGVFEITSPSTNTNRTQTLPDATGTVVLDSAIQTLTNKTFTTPNIDLAQFATVSGTAPIYPCRAWVNFNGTGTVAIRASGNVTSITDNGTGDYTANFTTAMPDANYFAAAMPGSGGTVTGAMGTTSQTTAAYRFTYTNTSGGTSDSSFAGIAIFR
jgi:hypothetical protein